MTDIDQVAQQARTLLTEYKVPRVMGPDVLEVLRPAQKLALADQFERLASEIEGRFSSLDGPLFAPGEATRGARSARDAAALLRTTGELQPHDGWGYAEAVEGVRTTLDNIALAPQRADQMP